MFSAPDSSEARWRPRRPREAAAWSEYHQLSPAAAVLAGRRIGPALSDSPSRRRGEQTTSSYIGV